MAKELQCELLRWPSVGVIAKTFVCFVNSTAHPQSHGGGPRLNVFTNVVIEVRESQGEETRRDMPLSAVIPQAVLHTSSQEDCQLLRDIPHTANKEQPVTAHTSRPADALVRSLHPASSSEHQQVLLDPSLFS